MRQIWTIVFVLFLFIEGRSQYNLGLGASIHRYDQVLSLKGKKKFSIGAIGLDLGLGVERSLQGALAPQLAVFWHGEVPRIKPASHPNQLFYLLRIQTDFQKASILDTHHGIYLGLGYFFGKKQAMDLQFSFGAVYEKIYATSAVMPSSPLFLNPQLQLNFHFSKSTK